MSCGDDIISNLFCYDDAKEGSFADRDCFCSLVLSQAKIFCCTPLITVEVHVSKHREVMHIATYARYADSGSGTATLGIELDKTTPVPTPLCAFAPHQPIALPAFS